jgi:hypothetical protein
MTSPIKRETISLRVRDKSKVKEAVGKPTKDFNLPIITMPTNSS